MWGYDYWELLANIGFIAKQLFEHGLFGVAVFCSVFFLTSIIQFAAFWVVGYGRRWKVSSDVAYGILISSLWLAASLALASHWLLDGLYYTPLSPPLDLQTYF